MRKESCKVPAGRRIGDVVPTGDVLCLKSESKIGKETANGLQNVADQLAS